MEKRFNNGLAGKAVSSGALSAKGSPAKKDDGFTLVELLIVIVIIGILAAILIPTYTDLIKRANLSADQVAVRDMNMALKAAEVESPVDTLGKARAVLADAGFNGDNLVPTTRDHKFYWNKTYNIVILVDCSDKDQKNWVAVNVDNNNEKAAEEFKDVNTRILTCFDLADFPNAKVTRLATNEKPFTLESDEFFGYPSSINLNKLDLGIVLNFAAVETPESLANSKYKDWCVDFRITISDDMTAKKENGEDVRYFLAGQYTAFSEDWVVLEATGITKSVAKEEFGGEEGVFYLLGTMGMTFSYEMICDGVQSFNCGVGIDGIHEGFIMKLELIMYENTGKSPYELTADEFIVINTFVYNPNDINN